MDRADGVDDRFRSRRRCGAGHDIDGDGVPEAFLARRDGFVNVFKLADGRLLGLLNAG